MSVTNTKHGGGLADGVVFGAMMGMLSMVGAMVGVPLASSRYP